jgi:hypothetical protein
MLATDRAIDALAQVLTKTVSPAPNRTASPLMKTERVTAQIALPLKLMAIASATPQTGFTVVMFPVAWNTAMPSQVRATKTGNITATPRTPGTRHHKYLPGESISACSNWKILGRMTINREEAVNIGGIIYSDNIPTEGPR